MSFNYALILELILKNVKEFYKVLTNSFTVLQKAERSRYDEPTT